MTFRAESLAQNIDLGSALLDWGLGAWGKRIGGRRGGGWKWGAGHPMAGLWGISRWQGTGWGMGANHPSGEVMLQG